jgi:hypothetical protein
MRRGHHLPNLSLRTGSRISARALAAAGQARVPLPREAVRTKPFRKRRCAFADVHARATVCDDLATDGGDDLATDGPPATDEMAVFGAHP